MTNTSKQLNEDNVSDPYRWLEDFSDPKVRGWVDEQNKKSYGELKNSDFEMFSKELTDKFKVVNFSNPIVVKGKYFYQERQKDENQFALYMKVGLNGTPIKLFDPNIETEIVSLDYWWPSHTAKFMAYGTSVGGDEMSTLYVVNTETNTKLSEEIVNCRQSKVRWLPDDSGFYYTRTARPGTVPKNEETLHSKVYLHKLGDDPNNDDLIFGKNRPKNDMLEITLSPDGRYLGIQASQEWTQNEIHIYDTKSKDTKCLTNLPHKFSIIFLHDKVILYTNFKANNYRIISSSYDRMFDDIETWTELIPEREHILQTVRISKSKIIVEYLVNVCSEVYIFDHNGKQLEKLPLADFSSLDKISARRDEEEFFYSSESFVFPKSISRYDPQSSKYVHYRSTENPIDPNDYVVKQEWYASKDGTRVPMFIFHKKNVNLEGANPTILSGYGGFGLSRKPMFMRVWTPWLLRGGVFALANIRGGGEFGEKWHRDGMLDKKQNSFDDFIAATDYLIESKYTNRKQLGIIGGSNGGLLVSAVSVIKPDLCKAVVSEVPLIDMVRFYKFGMAIRWINEYGDPRKEQDLINILRWSPYHNVKAGTKYPDFLLITADKDSRVDPMHARKMAAVLNESNKDNRAYLVTEFDAGHGPGKPVEKIVESRALVLAFFASRLGLMSK